MTLQQFITALQEKCSFPKKNKNFERIQLEDNQKLMYNKKVDIKAFNYLKINPKILGFRMDRILDLESSNELLLITGTPTKDGVYYLNHESSLITVEELYNDETAKLWIEDWMNISAETFKKLNLDEKVKLFENETQMYLLETSLEDFLKKTAIIEL